MLCPRLVVLVCVLLLLVSGEESAAPSWDSNGYILYCPCMGRFGNQAAHFLGSLAFAKALNRTLAVPPWRSYQRQQNVPFSDFFELEPVRAYHRILPLHDFMAEFAPTYWPPGNRTGYCYGPSPHSDHQEDCSMKQGNPFGPFWDEFSVEFDNSVFTRLSYQIAHSSILKMWHEKYPASLHPILAFKGAPASFPVLPEHRSLQRSMVWNQRMERQAADYINNTFGEATPFIGIHLRMGSDWKHACENAVGREQFMEAVQCLEGLPRAKITQDLCLPPVDFVVRHLVALTRRHRIYTVFVASDVAGEKHELQQKLGTRITTYYLSPAHPQLDLMLLAKADHFVGNCVSSFTAFVKRERDLKGKPSDFFGLSDIKDNYIHRNKKTEL